MIGATYRLQFREGFGFEGAAKIVPHLARAGITHLYASPVFKATTGSTHGYDVTDHNTLDPALGGEAAFEIMSAALKAAGLGLILDIVPNHMSASMENPWWRDVAMHGEASQYARHFDIDWSAGKLILPILGKPFGEALADGDVVRQVKDDGVVVLAIPGSIVPLAPGTEHIEDVEALHETQNYRLTHWRLGRDGLTYRRFFEVTGLVGVRVEDEIVFNDVHRLIEKLIHEGKVDGLRVDHVDGLSDPAGYLRRLSERVDVPILVEKILEPSEPLRDWPIEGTTGYEFIAAMAALFTSGEGLARLGEDYGAIAENDVAAMMREAKTLIITNNLAGELERLTLLAETLFAPDLSARDHGHSTIRDGLVALMTGMPVYRTYLPRADPEDDEVIAQARAAAEAEPLEDPRILDDLIGLLKVAEPDETGLEFIARFQQTSGPLMAKAVEDTLFYRHHRLLGLNEVGGELEPELGPDRYLRVARSGGLVATQTHDTKRGEDGRARLYALSDPAAVAVWSTVWPDLPGEIAPKLQWAFGQMLFAANPLGEDPDFTDRFREAALKTVREAKEETTWTRTDETFEDHVAAAAEAMVAARDRFEALADVARAGAVIGLAQALLKTTGRPAPDIYQGTFAWDFSMVDPDNRRPVDFEAEDRLCSQARSVDPATLCTTWQSGTIKARVLLEGLATRREKPEFFRDGTIEPLALGGECAACFAAFRRSHGEDTAVVVVPVRPLGLLGPEGLALAKDRVGDVAVALGAPLRDRFTGQIFAAERSALAEHFARFPVLFATSW